MRDALAILAIIVASVVTVLTAETLHGYAAPLSKMQEPGTCVSFATVGSFSQYHCVDPAGNEYDTNTAGFMIFLGN